MTEENLLKKLIAILKNYQTVDLPPTVTEEKKEVTGTEIVQELLPDKTLKHVKIGPTYMAWTNVDATVASPSKQQLFGYTIRIGDLVIVKFRIEADDAYKPWKHGYRWMVNERPIIPNSMGAPLAWKDTTETVWLHPVHGVIWDVISPSEPLVIHHGDIIMQEQFNITAGSVLYNYEIEYYYETV